MTYAIEIDNFGAGQVCVKWTEGKEGKYVTGNYVEEYGTGDHNFCRYHKHTLIRSSIHTIV